MTKSPGQLAYKEDVRRHPTYHDGSARKTWNQLCPIAQASWHQNPNPRSHRSLCTLAHAGLAVED